MGAWLTSAEGLELHPPAGLGEHPGSTLGAPAASFLALGPKMAGLAWEAWWEEWGHLPQAIRVGSPKTSPPILRRPPGSLQL